MTRPRHPRLWPAGTQMTSTDVVLGDLSLSSTARSEGTPCVRIAPRVSSRSTGKGTLHQTVLVARVTTTGNSTHGGLREVWLDADLGHCRPLLGESRLIGRTGSRRTQRVVIRPSASWPTLSTARLPDDLRPGDLIAIPCDGPTALADIRRPGRQRAVRSDDGESQSGPHCLR